MKKTILFIFILSFFSFYSCKKEKNSISESEIALGKKYGGGIIFYLDGSGQHGLVAAETNQSSAIRWYNGAYIVTGSTENAVGTGRETTLNIIDMQGAGAYAANLCEELALNGYNDWFLPSKNELNLLYQQRNIIGGFSEGYYWCATEYDSLHAWNQYFPYGPQYYADKADSACVRAIRAF
ncbi:MAG: DUF1566 domain-containing protein [Bacteroidia bacterium]